MKPKERLINACLGKEVDRPPVWLMRQAGRYLPEYQSLREKHSTKTLMTTPEQAANITLLPMTILGVDAAILYSDILMLPDAMGMGLSFLPGEGPVFDFAIDGTATLGKLNTTAINERLAFVFKAIKICLKKMSSDDALIGFAGAPFTVAYYMICGGKAANLGLVKNFAWTQPLVYKELLQIITTATIDFLIEQANAGVTVVQLFDTWAGELGPDDFRTLALPYCEQIFHALKQAYIPSIYFAKNTSHLLPDLIALPCDTVSVDWRTDLTRARELLGSTRGMQGNLDPDVLFTTPEHIEKRLAQMLTSVPNPQKGYIINLGHGILPGTPVKNVRFFVEQAKKSHL